MTVTLKDVGDNALWSIALEPTVGVGGARGAVRA
jgi:hypothetical protein